MARVFTSSVLNAPIAQVWARIRDFNALPTWNPNVSESEIEDGRPGDAVGCVRNFVLQDGGRLRERLLAFSDLEHACTYSILDSPMPLSNYVASLRLLPISDGERTYAEWSAEFDCNEGDQESLVASIGNDVFLASFQNLERQMSAEGAVR
ncbi:MAG: hypothetical protein ACI841_002355 [Planctomycetota bacterium]|jgi:hypothetical protein